MKLTKWIGLLLTVALSMTAFSSMAMASEKGVPPISSIIQAAPIMLDTEGVTQQMASEEILTEMPPQARGNVGSAYVLMPTITVYPRFIDKEGVNRYGGISTIINFARPNNHHVYTTISIAEQNRLLAFVEANGYTFNGWRTDIDYYVYNDYLPASRMCIVERTPVESKTYTRVGFTDKRVIKVGPENPKTSIHWSGYLEYMKNGPLISSGFNASVYFAK